MDEIIRYRPDSLISHANGAVMFYSQHAAAMVDASRGRDALHAVIEKLEAENKRLRDRLGEMYYDLTCPSCLINIKVQQEALKEKP